MQNKLQELTDKIYREGLEKGNTEAAAIIENAKLEAQKIIAAAHAQEKKILDDAARKSEELKQNTESELKLAMRQALNAMKQQTAGLVTARVSGETVKTFMSDPAFIKEIVLTLAKNWNPSDPGSLQLDVILPAGKEKELKDFFLGSASAVLNKGVELKFDSRLKSGFEIGPRDGGYRISFTDEVFESFFKEYLRPRVMNYLFGK